jgi:4-hydroxy-4-methyl-2-oxoglutarate aldolase
VIEAYTTLYTGLIIDHLGKHGAMHPDIKPVYPQARVCGPAVTVLGADWRLRFAAAELAAPGDVIVISPGDPDHACFGDLTATRWQAAGIAGVVIDGATRDVAGITAVGFPTFARRITPRTFHYPAGVDHGAINVPITCGATIVRPGDLVIGDDDGVVVVPHAVAADVAAAAHQTLEKETAKRIALARGEAPTGVATAELRARGYRFI